MTAKRYRSFIEAEKDRKIIYFIVEVKVKLSFSDVGSLLAKADVFEARVGEKPIPILAGVWIGDRVRDFASRRGVWVMAL